VTPEAAARLAELNIDYVLRPKGPSMFTRGDLVALAQLDPVSLGSVGMMTENGLAYLMWNDSKPELMSHGGKQSPATPGQVEKIRRFSTDLKTALCGARTPAGAPSEGS
jgi:hypothetical protein